MRRADVSPSYTRRSDPGRFCDPGTVSNAPRRGLGKLYPNNQGLEAKKFPFWKNTAENCNFDQGMSPGSGAYKYSPFIRNLGQSGRKPVRRKRRPRLPLATGYQGSSPGRSHLDYVKKIQACRGLASKLWLGSRLEPPESTQCNAVINERSVFNRTMAARRLGGRLKSRDTGFSRPQGMGKDVRSQSSLSAESGYSSMKSSIGQGQGEAGRSRSPSLSEELESSLGSISGSIYGSMSESYFGSVSDYSGGSEGAASEDWELPSTTDWLADSFLSEFNNLGLHEGAASLDSVSLASRASHPAAPPLDTSATESYTYWDAVCESHIPTPWTHECLFKRQTSTWNQVVTTGLTPVSVFSHSYCGVPDTLASPHRDVTTHKTDLNGSIASSLYALMSPPGITTCGSVATLMPPPELISLDSCEATCADIPLGNGKDPSLISTMERMEAAFTKHPTPGTPTKPQMLQTVLPYTAQNDWELGVSLDDHLFLLSDTRPGWSLVEHCGTGQTGYVPSNYLFNLTRHSLSPSTKITYC